MPRRLSSARGNVSLVIVILLPALIICAGLALDGGRQLQARRDVNAAAASAARAAIQMTAPEAAHGLDPGLATERAARELGRRGVHGSATVDGARVTVTASDSVDNIVLPGGRTVMGSATAHADKGVLRGGDS